MALALAREGTVSPARRPMLGMNDQQPSERRALGLLVGPLGMTDDGCLQSPWHAALYDVGTGGWCGVPRARSSRWRAL